MTAIQSSRSVIPTPSIYIFSAESILVQGTVIEITVDSVGNESELAGEGNYQCRC